MKKTRFILAMLLIFTMAISSVGVFSVYADDTTDEVKELPSSTTLVGTKHLPPISNQGEIGSCASQSITYMQMTNAVSRYLHSIDPDIDWNPSSGDKKYLMSPKFTFDFSGAGTAWVYNVLVDHGITTMDKLSFYMQPGNGAYKIFMAPGSKLQWAQSVKWAVSEGMLEEALEIRLQNWTSEEDQIWIRKDTFGDSNGEIMLTTTAKGQELLERVKKSLLDGNVVVTGGISGGWRTDDDKITGNGDIGKVGEKCLSWTTEGAGGHQVSIVGYDDNVECKINGVTLKGAFLVANSWGNWANDGYIWVMYDALNSRSQYAEVQAVRGNKRTITMDQFCFTDWRTDIAIGAPDLMVQVEVECVNREGTAIYLTRELKGTTNSEQLVPYMFYYGKIQANTHPDYDLEGMKYTFSGKQVKADTAPETAYFTVMYDNFLKTMEEGKTINDYNWGIRVYSVQKEPIVVKSVKLINSSKQVLSEIKVAEGGDKYTAPTNTGSLKYWFDFTTCDIKVNAEEGINVNFTKDTAKYVTEGNKISFTVDCGEGEHAKVLVNGTEITAENGVYTTTATATTTIDVTTTAAPSTTPVDTTVPPVTNTPANTDEAPVTTTPNTATPNTATPDTNTPDTSAPDDGNGSGTGLIIAIVAVVVVGLGVGIFFITKKKS